MDKMKRRAKGRKQKGRLEREKQREAGVDEERKRGVVEEKGGNGGTNG